MRRAIGRVRRIDDEWYTPRATADGVAAWLAKHLTPDTPILCPAEILPDGSESTIPQALRAAGFTSVRVTRDLPVDDLYADWIEGEVVVTNPPFSLLVPFMEWCRTTGARFCILARPGGMRRCWSIPEMKDRFRATNGRSVAAAWMQNIHDTSAPDPSRAIGNCRNCERKACPKNSMTGHLKPGEDRPLYGWRVAAGTGVAGWFCVRYTTNGKIHFTRFFHARASSQPT